MPGVPLMMWWVVALLAVGGASVLATRTFRERRAAKLANVADEQFLALMAGRTQATAEAVMRERLYLAKAIGIPVNKLHPDSALRDIAAVYPGFGKQITMNDLTDDLFGLAKDATGRADNVKLPETVGDLIALRLSLRP
jgi:ABC-type iron transport system FetAB permease component